MRHIELMRLCQNYIQLRLKACGHYHK